MSEVQIRNLFIDDSQWERTSPSWKSLKPNKNFDHIDVNDEDVDNYYKRINETYKIPKPVLEQWLYIHYYNGHTVDNYGWINYNNVRFELVDLSFSAIAIESVNIIESYHSYVIEGSKYNAYTQFNCVAEDKKYWESNNTWRVPPIVMDVESFKDCVTPSYADISGSYQLVEGHTRLGYLLSANKCEKPINKSHKVYLMQYNDQQ